MKIALIEDDDVQTEYIRKEIEDIYQKKHTVCAIDAFESAEQFLFHYPESYPFDCLLVDIGLKKMDGMELAKVIRGKDKEIPLIFITGEEQYVFEGYKVGAARFLVKPYHRADLEEALECVTKQSESKEQHFLNLKIAGEYVKLCQEEILYLEVNGHYLRIYTVEQEYEFKGTMKEMQAAFPEDGFAMANRSTMVNLSQIDRLNTEECFLTDGTKIAVSRGCKKNLSEKYRNLFR